MSESLDHCWSTSGIAPPICFLFPCESVPDLWWKVVSTPAEGQQQQQQQQQQQLKMTSDVTSEFHFACHASVLWSGKGVSDVASDRSPDEALSCRRRRAWDGPYCTTTHWYGVHLPLQWAEQLAYLSTMHIRSYGSLELLILSASSPGDDLRLESAIPLHCDLSCCCRSQFWEKESIHRPAPVQNFFFAEKNGGHRGKISVVHMVFLVFIWFFVSTTGLESSSLKPEEFSKRFSFGGGSARFFFSAILLMTLCLRLWCLLPAKMAKVKLVASHSAMPPRPPSKIRYPLPYRTLEVRWGLFGEVGPGIVRPALSRGMDWWRLEWPFSRALERYFHRPSLAENSLIWAIFVKEDPPQLQQTEVPAWSCGAKSLRPAAVHLGCPHHPLVSPSQMYVGTTQWSDNEEKWRMRTQLEPHLRWLHLSDFSPNFRLRNLKIQSPKKTRSKPPAMPYPH